MRSLRALFLAPLAGAALASAPLAHEAVLGAPPEEIWKVFSTAEGAKALGVAKADLDFRPGGLLRTAYDAQVDLAGERAIHTEIVAYDPGHVLVTRIHRPPKGFPFPDAWRRVWTVISLAPEGAGATRLRVAMVGYGDDEQSLKMRAFFEKGNAWVMDELRRRFPLPVVH